MDYKREQILARLGQRNKERESNVETQRQGKNVSKSQNVLNFDHQFEAIRDRIAELLKECDVSPASTNVSNATLDNEKLEEVGSLLQKLQKLTAEFASTLSSYDMRRSQKLLQELQVQFLNSQNKCQPKKRFAFTSRKKDGLIKGADFDAGFDNSINVDSKHSSVAANGERDATDAAVATVENKRIGTHGVKAMTMFNAKSARGEVFNFGSECTGSDVVLEDLVECFVKITGLPSTLYVNKLENCTLLCYPVSTSVFVENCRQVDFVLACQQLRIHASTECRFYVHVTSKAIVEDCSGLAFAPYSLTLSNNVDDERDLKTLFDAASLDFSRNNWDTVEDFNWPVKNTPSPNWGLIPEKDRKTFLI